MKRNNQIILLVATITVLATVGAYLANSAASSAQETDSEEITVSAAASLTESYREIVKQFEAANPDIEVNLNLASSGSLRMQIEGGAPIDVFASASQKHMDILDAKDMIDADSRRDFARNSLVMIVPAGTNQIETLEDLDSEEITKIALGNPETAPVGRYAKQGLEEAGLWQAIEGKTIFAENVKQVLVYVERGEVDAGFVYMTDAQTSESDNIRIVGEVPVDADISYPVAILADSEDKEASHKFIDFVTGPEGKRILEEYGFKVE
ncbi:molybdate ABC transporter substrate-binding protein [Methanohalophilus portucalensis]|uniref:Molybdate ABC transporter substrate-binding protein n=2 Tax=Methanohalophilus portucalensis TaxID=39664 RepID=A0A1L9C234_9EURY|nr:molybdate ABC transporter substrate-binding protein [Methanohalophilus portucalensis]ATU07402.1 molybdate ABC transporter substrate-binding protein [Methanohalophilus portucalensis]OJH48547.1 molybdenum ABC transporter periplasmic molybdate-binding protein [Methanohalophilus portucalensis FDF-1]RNI09451.1 molybdate ABC transporter substrate-binding protein [Methanohalophilus portucalensis FDF-1]SMH39540.1 molybdate transport system substrate-binding protein [Methanohalophilus portucalensis F